MIIRILRKTHRKTFKTMELANAYKDSIRSDWDHVAVWDLSVTLTGRKGFMVLCSGKIVK